VGDLIGIIAHQLKQPLGAISLANNFMNTSSKMGVLNSDIIDEHTGHINHNVGFMTKSIDDLRNLFNPNKVAKAFAAKGVVEKTYKLIDTTISSSGITVEQNYNSEGLVFGVDSELQQVVLNLINNAKEQLLKVKPQNPTITILVDESDEVVEIVISDNAGGVPSENIEKIFDSYFTTKGESGTGLGLYLAKMIIQDTFQGVIGVQNRDGGARFTIEIPKSSAKV
jgi:two-component system sensor histidine kinase/response regulator